MQAALITGKRSIEMRDMPTPEASPGRAVVEIGYCGVCGTDLDAWLSGEPYNPAICGHEWMGVVTQAPPEPGALSEGLRVGIGISAACGACEPCRKGQADYCEPAFAGVIGLGPLAAAHGGFAPAIAIDAARLYPVKDGISDVAAAMLEPITVALHAVRRTGVQAGDACILFGAGPIGLLTMQCALAAGAGTVVVVEPSEARRAQAARMGAGAVIDPRAESLEERCRALFGAGGPDIAFECSGVSEVIGQAAGLLRRGGTLSLVGLASQPAQIDPADWLIKEVRVVASLAYLHWEFDLAMSLLQDGRLKPEPLHTSTSSLADLPQAFERLHENASEVKILVDPRL